MSKIAVILNPAKLSNRENFKKLVLKLAKQQFKPAPEVLFYETSVKDPGAGQCREALKAGANLVIAAGGDGTVRIVAGELVKHGSNSPAMAVVPVGTGNLLARNLSIPVKGTAEALKIAFGEKTKQVDLGWLSYGATAEAAIAASAQPFMVISGFGFDAKVMEQTNSKLKKYLGSVAYLLAGIKNIIGRAQPMRITLDSGESKLIAARTVMIGNVGKLQAGFNLMPEADPQSGYLEVLALNWQSLFGFGQLVRKLFSPKSAKIMPKWSEQKSYKTAFVTVNTRKLTSLQIDGDYLGQARHLRAEIAHSALKIKVP